MRAALHRIEWAHPPNGRVRFLYDFDWGDHALGIYQDSKGERFNADPDHGGLPAQDVIPVEAMVRRQVKDWDGEWDWEFEGYAMIEEIPRGAYVLIGHDAYLRHTTPTVTTTALWSLR